MRGPVSRRVARCLAALGGLMLLAGSAHAEVERYRIDPVHSRVLIRVSHSGFAQAMATLSAPRGVVLFDAEAPERSQVEVELPLERLDFGDAEWNARMARADYFDSERHPLARFTSERVEALDDGRLRIHGQLELRGRRAPVMLEARINRVGRDLPWVPRHSLGASATATLDREAFGMRKHRSAVGREVELWIELEARRERERERGRDRDTAAPADARSTAAAGAEAEFLGDASADAADDEGSTPSAPPPSPPQESNDADSQH